jgi:cyclic pyranopterin phosphate synthase
MPEKEYMWLPRTDLLTLEETSQLVDIFTELGVTKVRLTGGEPLLRNNVKTLIRLVSKNPRVKDLALTTNGILLADHAQSLLEAGLHRVTVSLDTLRAPRFKALTRKDSLDKVLEGIERAQQVGLKDLKLDTVVLRGFNDDEIVDLIEFGKRVDAEVRFIEYMDVGGATRWSMNQVVSKQEILDVLETHYGTPEPLNEQRWAPAQRYVLADGVVFGIISSTTDPFCRTCDRSRLTADGHWYLCLYAHDGVQLRQPLRDGASREELKSLIQAAWSRRDDRGAEIRKELSDRSALAEAGELRQNPHREMHTRGG